MKSFWRLLRYLGRYRSLVVSAIACNVLTAVFTVISIPMLIPFFQILFDRTQMTDTLPEGGLSLMNTADYFNYQFSQLITTQGQETALAYVCVAIVIVYLLRNLFRYLALFFMAPVRNGVIRDLRAEMFDQVLTLPLSYFGEERKGDLLARLTSDVQEVEASILNMLEVVFRSRSSSPEPWAL